MSTMTPRNFRDVPVGAEFRWQGVHCRKVSTRTAEFVGRKAARFYFRMTDAVTQPRMARGTGMEGMNCDHDR